MATEARVKDFSGSLTGLTQAAAVAALEAIDANVLIAIRFERHDTITAGSVITHDVDNIELEQTGGPSGSHGVQVTLTVSAGRATWFASLVNQTVVTEAVSGDPATSTRHWLPFIAVDLDFPTGHVRLWSGYGVITIEGNVYQGAGHLARVSSSADRSNLVVDRKTYQLSGTAVDPAIVTEEDIDASFGRSVVEYLGFLDPNTRQLYDTPEIVFEGEIANIRRVDGRAPMIEINADHRMINLDRADGWRFTHEHQLEFYDDDLGLQWVPLLEMREILWGGHRVGGGIHYTGGGHRRERDQPRPP